MIRQYPYQLWAKLATGFYNQNTEGDWEGGGAPTWTQVVECRDEMASTQRVVLEDGDTYVVRSIVQLPLRCPVLPRGTAIEVRDGTTVRVSGEVRSYVKNQLHCQLWV